MAHDCIGEPAVDALSQSSLSPIAKERKTIVDESLITITGLQAEVYPWSCIACEIHQPAVLWFI